VRLQVLTVSVSTASADRKRPRRGGAATGCALCLKPCALRLVRCALHLEPSRSNSIKYFLHKHKKLCPITEAKL